MTLSQAAAPAADAAAASATAAPVEEAMPDAGTSGADATAAGAGSSATSPGPSPEQTGFFELKAVLTHKGRSADSGHYVGWVKQKDGSWMQFDDERPIPSTEDAILRLNGGGDHHMAYILLYRVRAPLASAAFAPAPLQTALLNYPLGRSRAVRAGRIGLCDGEARSNQAT